MLEVTFYRDGRDRPSRIFASGHADFAEHGSDVVCAAVSAILQAARLGLAEYAGIALDAEQASGDLRLSWPPAAREDASLRAIVGTAELSVERIAGQYPDYVRFRRERDAAV